MRVYQTCRRIMLRAVLVGMVLLQSGCYYLQAANGQFEVLRKREPITEVLVDPGTSDELARRLRLVADARDYSIAHLGLPDNGSYRSYADLERPYVVWSVFATPEFSLAPKTWCYPVAGCVSYRGYFKQAAAERVAARLAGESYDTYVGGVAAYSTLGRFDDPVLNTMMRWSDVHLVGVLFHELAHQQLYAKDDTAFNESFATAVQEIGLERYLRDRDRAGDFSEYEEQQQFRRSLMALLNSARDDLAAIYVESVSDEDKRSLKAHRYEQLSGELKALLEETGRDADAWLAVPFNNARLGSFSLYEGYVPSFRRLYLNCEQDIACFYRESERLADLPANERQQRLNDLLPAVQGPP